MTPADPGLWRPVPRTHSLPLLHSNQFILILHSKQLPEGFLGQNPSQECFSGLSKYSHSANNTCIVGKLTNPLIPSKTVLLTGKGENVNGLGFLQINVPWMVLALQGNLHVQAEKRLAAWIPTRFRVSWDNWEPQLRTGHLIILTFKINWKILNYIAYTIIFFTSTISL